MNADGVADPNVREANVKRILEGLLKYNKEALNVNLTSVIGLLSPAAIAKEGSAGQLQKMSELVLGCAVQCQKKQTYISNIINLDETAQHCLMVIIRRIMDQTKRLQEPKVEPEQVKKLEEATATAARMGQEKEQLFQKFTETKREVDQLKMEKEELLQEQRSLQASLAQAEKAREDDAKEAAETLRTAQQQAKEASLLAETQRHKLEDDLAARQENIRTLQQKLDDMTDATREQGKLKDELDILRAKAEEADKLERANAKYKEKIAEMGDFRARIAQLEDENQRLLQKQVEQEQQLKMVTVLQTQGATYKEQVAALETRINDLTQEKERFESKAAKARDAATDLTSDKSLLQAEVESLKRRLADSAGGDSGAASSAIGDSLLQERLKSLEHENRQLRAAAGGSDAQQAEVMQGLLDDATRQKNKALEDLSVASRKIHALEDRLEDAERRTAAGAGAGVAAGEIAKQIAALTAELGTANAEKAAHAAEINKYMKEKEAFQAAALAAKEDEVKRERQAADLQAQIATKSDEVSRLKLELARKDGEGAVQMHEQWASQQQRVHELELGKATLDRALEEFRGRALAAEDQNRRLLTEKGSLEALLQKAKEFIKQLQASIAGGGDITNAASTQQVIELQKEIDFYKRELDESRESAKREQRLVVTAFYELGLELQRMKTQKRMGATKGEPLSWLGQKRKNTSATKP